jgi:hypothetical protein
VKPSRKKARIGISIGVEPGASVFNSGLNQNLLFFAQLLAASPEVERVVLLRGGTGQELPTEFSLPGLALPLVTPQDVTHDLDMVFEFGVSLPLEWVRHVRALGTKVVAYIVGHTYTGQAEGPIFGRAGGTIFVGTPWHEVWTLPHHMKTSGPMLRTLSRVPVHAVPHIWSPAFLEPQIARQAAAGRTFGFRGHEQTHRAWRVGIFEPNISVVKNCFIPMLVCDAAYRQRPEALDTMMVMNTFHMKEHSTFNAFASHLDLTRDHKASYEPRLAFVECMADHRLDAVVAHQWECGLNYLYYDALHGGYPLVHNSDFLRDAGVGFHYAGFEATAGADRLLAAWRHEPGFWADYRAHAAAWLATLHPTHEENIRTYTREIVRLMEDRDGRA